MKNVFIVMILLASICFGSGPGTFGVPPYLWQTTYALNVTNGEANLPLNHADVERFISKIHSAVATKYPAVSLNWNNDIRDSYATRNSFLSGVSNNSEMFYFAGHGTYNHLRFYDNFVSLQELQLSYWTRWGFLVSCLTLNEKNPNSSYYVGAFSGGIHALVGYESDHRWYIAVRSYCGSSPPWPCTFYRSEDKWDKFAQKWITNSNDLIYAWFNSVKETSYDQGGQGVSPALVYNYGYIGNTFYMGGLENLETMYNGQVPANFQRAHCYVKYGTPYYGGVQ